MKIAVVDIETTGFLNEGGLILEVGIVELNLKTGFMCVLYNELVREEGFGEQHKNSWIFKNSDLDYNDILKAKPLNKNKIQSILNEYPVTAYNKKFDLDFFRSRGLEIKKELPCPMQISTPLVAIKFEDSNDFKWPKVQEAWDFFFPGTDYVESHRGADDALHEAQIIHHLYQEGYFKIE